MKRFLAQLLCLPLFFAAHAATAQTTLTFYATEGAEYYEYCADYPLPWGPPVYQCRTQQGSFVLTPSTTRPANTNTQWMSFWIRSDGYFTSMSRKDHLAMALKGQWTGVGGPGGRGLILGAVVDHPGGCNRGQASGPYSAHMQIESYWADGNEVWQQSCTPWQFGERTWYHVIVHVSGRYVAYSVRDEQGAQVYTSPAIYDDQNYFIDEQSTGWWFGHATLPRLTADFPAESRNWRLEIWGIETGWF